MTKIVASVICLVIRLCLVRGMTSDCQRLRNEYEIEHYVKWKNNPVDMSLYAYEYSLMPNINGFPDLRLNEMLASPIMLEITTKSVSMKLEVQKSKEKIFPVIFKESWAISPFQLNRDCFNKTFSNGVTIVDIMTGQNSKKRAVVFHTCLISYKRFFPKSINDSAVTNVDISNFVFAYTDLIVVENIKANLKKLFTNQNLTRFKLNINNRPHSQCFCHELFHYFVHCKDYDNIFNLYHTIIGLVILLLGFTLMCSYLSSFLMKSNKVSSIEKK